MSSRQALGTILSITGTLVVTRMIGPETYGLFASATAIQSYVGSFANSGVEVSLLRTHPPDAERRDSQGVLLVMALSILGALLCLALLPWLSRWIDAPKLEGPGLLVFGALPLTVIWIVPRARLSREMAFSRIAAIELVSQGAGVLLALVLAALGAGLWAPTLGWFAQNVALTTLFFSAAPALPRRADRATLRALLRDSWSFSASSLMWQSKSLVNPLLVGHFLGAESVGYAALCGRIIEALSFVRTATWHMLIASFAKLRDETDRLRSYLATAAELQVLALAPLLVAFSVLGPVVFPRLMGDHWRPVVDLFPFLATGALGTCIATPMVAALYARGVDFGVFLIRVVQVGVVATATWLLIPRFGLIGFGYGEATVVVTSALFGVLSGGVIGRTRSSTAWLWLAVAVALIFWQWIGPFVFFTPVLTFLFPRSRAALREHIGLLRMQLAHWLPKRA